MLDAITAGPRPVGRVGVPTEVSYSLQAEDYVAYWVHLAGRGQMPKRAHKAMLDAVGIFWGVIWMVGIFLSMLVCALHLPVGLPLVITSALGLGLAFAFMLGRVDRAPGASFGGWLSKPYRWLCYGALRRLARSESQEGVLDTQSLYRFAMNAEGFTLTIEYAASPAGQGPLARREDHVAWAALEDAVFTDDHVFLTVRKGVAVIVPGRSFSDNATLLEFTSLILGSRTAGRREPGGTSLFAPEDRLTAGARKPFAS